MQENPFQLLELTDFSGGETDTPLSAPLNQAEMMQNLLVNKNKKPYSRQGSELYDEDCPRYTAITERISHLDYFKGTLYGYHGKKVSYSKAGVRTDLTGSTGNDVFNEGTVNSIPDSAEWNSHLIAVNDAFATPQKIFVGLGLLEAIRLANDLKSVMTAHFANAAAHTTGVDAAHPISSDDAIDLPSLIALTTELLAEYAGHHADAELASGWAYHVAQELANTLTSVVSPTSLDECIARLLDLQLKFNAHAGTVSHATGSTPATATPPAESVRVRTAGLPDLATPPIVFPQVGANSYTWAFAYQYQYSVGDVLHVDIGPITYVQKTGADSPDSTPVHIYDIPYLDNGVTNNYDLSYVRIIIWRTTNGGSTFYKIADLQNGESTYDDEASDADIEGNDRIYNDGIEIQNDPPPPAKTVGITNNVAIYGHVKEDGVIYPNRIRQSIPNDVDSVPREFFADLDSAVVSVATYGGRHYVLCEKKIYRVDSYFDETGDGGLALTVISERVGTIAVHSVVVTEEGFAFAADDGFYYCDGNRVYKTTRLKSSSYRDLIQDATRKARIYGDYEQEGRRIWWACQEGSGSDNDCMWVFDLNQGIKDDGCYTTMRGQNLEYQPTAIQFLPNLDLVRADSRGYVVAHREGLYNDLVIDTTTNPDTWLECVVPYIYKTVATNFGTAAVRKWVPEVTIFCDALTSLTIDTFSYNDRTQTRAQLKEIRYRGTVRWGDTEVLWGDSVLFWNFITIIKARRKFPAMGLRCSWKQLELRNAETEIYRSDDRDLATPDTTLNTVTVDSGEWPEDVVGYAISFNNDGYERTYEITSRNSDTVIAVADPDNMLPSVSSKWHIVGLRKNEGILLDTIAISYKPLSNSHSAYRGESNANSE